MQWAGGRPHDGVPEDGADAAAGGLVLPPGLAHCHQVSRGENQPAGQWSGGEGRAV